MKHLLTVMFAASLLYASAQTQTIQDAGSAQKPEIVDNGYFKYEVTGNAMTDEENYARAKEQFVTAYPEKYNEMVENFARENELNQFPASESEPTEGSNPE